MDGPGADDERPWRLDLTVAPEQFSTPQMRPKNPVLAKGTKGPDVGRLQRFLTGAGFELEVDDDFGPNTDRAVRAFQRDRKLVADGIVGPATWEALGA